MDAPLFAAGMWGLSVTDLAIRVVIAVCILAVVWVILTKVAGVQIPPYVMQIVWIVVGCVIGVLAIIFLANLA